MGLYSADCLLSLQALKADTAGAPIEAIEFDKDEAIDALKRARVSDHAFRRAAYARGLDCEYNMDGQLVAIHKTLGIIV